MKRIGVLILIIVLSFSVALYATGCGSSGGNGGPDEPPISESTAAEGVAKLAQTTHLLISNMMTMIPTIGFIVGNYDANKGFALPLTIVGSVGGITDFYFKAYDQTGTEITDKNNINSSSVSKFSIYVAGSFTIAEPNSSNIQKRDISSLFYIGETEQNPFVIDVEEKTANGKTIAQFNYESDEIRTSLGFVDLNISSKYPDGIVNISVAVGGTEIYECNLNYNGTDSATLDFTDGGTYNISLESSSGP